MEDLVDSSHLVGEMGHMLTTLKVSRHKVFSSHFRFASDSCLVTYPLI